MLTDSKLFYNPSKTSLVYAFVKEYADFVLSPYVFDFNFHTYGMSND